MSDLARLLKRDPIERIEGQTLTKLCGYFGCGVGDILEYAPGAEEAGRQEVTGV